MDMLLTPGRRGQDGLANDTFFCRTDAARGDAQRSASCRSFHPTHVEIIVLSDRPVGWRTVESVGRSVRPPGGAGPMAAGRAKSVRLTREGWLTASGNRRAAPTFAIEPGGGRSNEHWPKPNRCIAAETSTRRCGWRGAPMPGRLRSQWQLGRKALMPQWDRPTSCPPIDLGASEIQIDLAAADGRAWLGDEPVDQRIA